MPHEVSISDCGLTVCHEDKLRARIKGQVGFCHGARVVGVTIERVLRIDLGTDRDFFGCIKLLPHA
jgi:hypothetical protein